MLSLATIIFCSDLDNYVPIWFVFFPFFGNFLLSVLCDVLPPCTTAAGCECLVPVCVIREDKEITFHI